MAVKKLVVGVAMLMASMGALAGNCSVQLSGIHEVAAKDVLMTRIMPEGTVRVYVANFYDYVSESRFLNYVLVNPSPSTADLYTRNLWAKIDKSKQECK